MGRGASILGCGVVSASGVGMSATWESLLDGSDAAPSADGSGADGSGEGQPLALRRPPEIRIRDYVRQRRSAKLMTSEARFALAAATEAVTESEISPEILACGAVHLVVVAPLATYGISGNMRVLSRLSGEGIDELSTKRLFQLGLDGNPLEHLKSSPDLAAAHIAINLGHTGTTHVLGGGYQSAAKAIGDALCMIRAGGAPYCLVVGADDGTTFGALALQRRLSMKHVPSWDHGALIPGGGAGALLLADESPDHANGSLAKLLGYAEVPRDEQRLQSGLEGAIEGALEDAGIGSRQIDVVHLAACTGDPVGLELAALSRLLPEGAQRPAAFSSGPSNGYLFAGSATFDVALMSELLRAQVLPPEPPDWNGPPYHASHSGTNFEYGLVCHTTRGGATAATVVARS